MFVADLLFALILAIVLTAILAGPARWRHPATAETSGATALFLFVLLFLVIWVGGLWLAPFGPPLWGGYWAPFVAVAIVLGLILLAAAAPPRRPLQAGAAAHGPVVVFGVFFWILAIVLIVGLFIGYLT